MKGLWAVWDGDGDVQGPCLVSGSLSECVRFSLRSPSRSQQIREVSRV